MIHTSPPNKAEYAELMLNFTAQKADSSKTKLNWTSQKRIIPCLFSRLFTYSPKFHRAQYKTNKFNNQRHISMNEL